MSWINTYTGRQFWPLNPRVEDVDLEDIAHALSLQCRFTGHVHEFYSVAQHCCLVAERVPDADKLWALLHDAPEAYLIDLARPVKQAPELQGYRDAEERLMAVIAERFGLVGECPESVKDADTRMLMTEAHSLMTMHPQWLVDAPWQRYPGLIDTWSPAVAKVRYLNRVVAAQAVMDEPRNDPARILKPEGSLAIGSATEELSSIRSLLQTTEAETARLRLVCCEYHDRACAAEAKCQTTEAERDEYKVLAAVGTWHDGCRPNRVMAARELLKSQAIIDRLADRISELESRLTSLTQAQHRLIEQCICAAIRLPNGEVWRGHRHDNAIHTAMAAPDVTKAQIYQAEQGFVTSRNRFVGREEGAEIQRRAGIVSASTMHPVSDMLFSEDLYLRDWRSVDCADDLARLGQASEATDGAATAGQSEKGAPR